MFDRNQIKEAILHVLSNPDYEDRPAWSSRKNFSLTTRDLAHDVRNHLGIEYPYSAAAHQILSNARVRLACKALEREDKIENHGFDNQAKWVILSDEEKARRKAHEEEYQANRDDALKAHDWLVEQGFHPITGYDTSRVTLSGRDMWKLVVLYQQLLKLRNDTR